LVTLSKMDKRIGVVLFGFGRIGRIHARSLVDSRRAQILYIVEELDDVARKDINESEWSLIFSDQTQVLKPADAHKALVDKRVQGIVICVPTRLHDDVIALACKYKKHIFCEKPVSASLDGTVKSYALAKAANVTLLCALNRRFDPALLKVQKQVASGRIGKLQLITSIGRDHPEPPAEYFNAGSGSMFVDMAIHNFDLISWVAGEYPIQVTAMGHASKEAYKERDDYDVIALMLKYPSGLIAYVDGCRYAPYGYDQRFEVVGNKGAMVAENQRDEEVILRTPEGDMTTPIQYSFPERYQKSYTAEIIHFLDILEGKAQCTITSESVINGIKAALAAEEACKSGKVTNITY